LKIDRLDVKLLRLPLAQFFETSFGRSYEKSFLLIRLEGEGHVGWGESVAEGHPYYSSETTETTWHIITEFLAQRVVGKTFEHPRDIFPAMARVRGNNMAKAGVEMAAWDLYARIVAKPLSAVLGGTRERVAPEVHRRRAGVARAAAENDLGARLAGDGRHDADREFFGFEDRSLFDVNFDVAEQVGLAVRRLGRRKRRAISALERGANRNAVGIDELEIGGAELAGVGLAAEVGTGETHAFLLRETEDFDGERERDFPPTELGERHDRQEHPERAVEAARIADGVEVRPQQERAGSCAGGAIEAANQVARGIFVGGETGVAHPVGDAGVGAAHRRREKRARKFARLVGDAGELVEITTEKFRAGVHQLPR
jgi:hypothetical protein